MKRTSLLELAAMAVVAWGAYSRRRDFVARGLRLPPALYDVDIEYGLRIAMRDGVRLAADHYFPHASGGFPTIFIRTPYGRRRSNGTLGLLHTFCAQRFAERGFHVITQDTRGRFDSEGVFTPMVDERADGLDSLDWIARQPWFNGQLGMWGQSYGGYVQWAVAADAPPYLRSLVPSITGSQLCPYTGTAFGFDPMVRWITNLAQGDERNHMRNDLLRMLNPRAATRALAAAFKHLPISEADVDAVGQPVPHYREWLQHAHSSAPYWQTLHYGRRMESVRASVHLVSGWFDILLHQLLIDYAALRAVGHTPYLTIGPWRHSDLTGAAESLRAGIVWAEAQLKGNRSYLRDKPVRLYEMTAGGGTWREFDSFPPPATESSWFLHPHKRLAQTLPAANAEPDSYCYDPNDPTPSVGGPMYHYDAGSVDNRELEARRDVLTYTSAPLAHELVVIGSARLELFIRSSLDYTDFFARLCDVYPDGRSMNVSDDLVRLEPGDGEMQPDGSRRISINLWETAYRFKPGHALRLIVASGAHPRWARNPGTGEPLASATKLLASNQTVYHDSAHPSAVTLPVTP